MRSVADHRKQLDSKQDSLTVLFTGDGDTAPGYSIAEFAERGGVTRRTVRYYVQRGLLDPPEGAGRGARYTDAHLRRLERVRTLQ